MNYAKIKTINLRFVLVTLITVHLFYDTLRFVLNVKCDTIKYIILLFITLPKKSLDVAK